MLKHLKAGFLQCFHPKKKLQTDPENKLPDVQNNK